MQVEKEISDRANYSLKNDLINLLFFKKVSAEEKERIINSILNKIEDALNGNVVEIKLNASNAILLRNYINKNFSEILIARAIEREENNLWVVKLYPKTLYSKSVPKKIFNEQTKVHPTTAHRSLADYISTSVQEIEKLNIKKKFSSEEEYKNTLTKAKKQVFEFVQKTDILNFLSPSKAQEFISGLLLTFLEYNISDAALNSIILSFVKKFQEIKNLADDLIKFKGLHSRFSPHKNVSDDEIKLQVVSAYLAGIITGFNPIFLITISNYESGMRKTAGKHGKGPMQITRASIYSEGVKKAGTKIVNSYLPWKSEEISYRGNFSTLNYSARNALVNYLDGAETLLLKMNIITKSKNKITPIEIESLPYEDKLQFYKLLSYYYNGSIIAKQYSNAIYSALLHKTYNNKEILWLKGRI